MNSERLDRKAFKSAGPTLALRVLTQALQLVVGILMVRMLMPADYGIWGILNVFWTVCNMFIYGGFASALVQKKEVDEVDLCSVFYYNMVLSLVCVAVLWVAAPWVAGFFGQPVLKDLLRFVAWILPMMAFAITHNVLLSREMRQDVSNLCLFVGTVLGMPYSLWLAWKGYGAWAFAQPMMLSTAISSLLVMGYVRWRPKLCFSFAALGRLFKYGSNLLIAGLIDSIFGNVYNLIIGKVYPIATLGYYERGRQYAALWPQSIQWTVSSVLFAAFSKIQEDVPRLRNAVAASLKMCVFIIFFPSILLGVLAVPFVTLVLSEKWLPIVPYFQVLTISFVLFPIQYMNLQIPCARGKSGIYLGLVIADKVLLLLNVLCTVWFGVMAMVWGMVVVSSLSLFLYSRYPKWVIGYSLGNQFRDCFPYLLHSVLASAGAWGLYRLIYPWHAWLGLLVPGFVGCALYAFLNWWFQTEAFVTAWRLGQQQLQQLRKKENRN